MSALRRNRGRRLRPLHAASGSELETISKLPMVTTNNGMIAYVMKKIIPPTLPLSSTLVEPAARARQEGRPIPNEKPHKTNNVAIPYSPNLGKIIENNDEITPIRIQKVKKRVLEIFSATKGPISKDTMVAVKSRKKNDCSSAIVNTVKNHIIELKIRKKIRKNCLR